VREPVADLDAAAATLLKADLQGTDLVPLLAVGIVDHHDAGQLQFFRILHILVRRFGDGLAGVLGE
jgi:hypothetical protein